MGVRGTGVAVAIAGSAILHVGLLAVLDAVDAVDIPLVGPVTHQVRLTLEPRRRPPLPPDAAIPIELVMLAPAAAPPPPAPAALPTAAADLPAAPAAVPRADGARPPTLPAPDPDALVASAVDPRGPLAPGATGLEPTGPGEPGLPGEPGMLSMRTPRPLRPIIDPWRAKLTVAPVDPATVYHPPEPSGQLRPDGGGTFRTVRPGFTGHVAPDGRISFKDQPSATMHVKIPRPRKLARAVGRGLERWYADPGAIRRAGEPDPDELPGVRATETEDPDEDDPDAVIIPIIGGTFDATDAVMRAAGMDPYASAKLKWMDETRPERLQMAQVQRERELGKSTQSMRRHLARLWARRDLDDAGRRAALFELWDDCVETGDEAVVEACQRTRAEVIGSIRARLPAGSPAAYTADELRDLNRRRVSTIPFAPY